MTFSREYAHENHYRWIENTYKIKCSPLGKTIANIIGYVADGIYNAPIKPEKIEWDNNYYIYVTWKGDLTNWDRWNLSKLFILCVHKLVRFSIEPTSPTVLTLCFNQRESREGGVSHCLPSIEELVRLVSNDFKKEDQL